MPLFHLDERGLIYRRALVLGVYWDHACVFKQARLRQVEVACEKEFDFLRSSNSTSMADLDRLTADLAVVKSSLASKETEVSLSK